MTEGSITHVYEYDSLDRLIRAYQKDVNGNITVAVENTYDELGRAKGSTYAIGDRTMEYSVNYKQNSNLVSSLRMPDASEYSQMSVIGYTYDSIDRLTEKVISMSSNADLSEEYSYYTYTDADGERHTTSLVSSIALRSNNASGYDVVYSYVYDNLGNITEVYIEGILIESYEYDSLGQLIRENNVLEDYTILYSYDQAGNITSKEQFVYATAPTWHMEALSGTGTLTSYTYGNSTWGDLLTNYNGTAISYDAIGNPTNWCTGDISSLTWSGRELQSAVILGGPRITYAYNSDGIRTQKTIGGSKVYNYTLDGSKIIRETVTNNGAASYDFYYLYDESGSVQGLIYNDNYYYYQKNLQGDVIRILNYSGNVVVEYTYDAWGKVLSVTGSLASTIGQYNPFRYRSYYYDVETGFYYLKSRYYDPVVGRFLNADSATMIGANGKLASHNLFTYALNNPTMLTDPNGYDAIALFEFDGIPHMGALIQDEDGKWWHFYWGPSDGFGAISLFGIPVPNGTWCVPFNGAPCLSSINSSGQHIYDEMVYIEGDFTESVKYAKNVDGAYKLYTNNCLQKTTSILAQSNTDCAYILTVAGEKTTIPQAYNLLKDSVAIINNQGKQKKNRSKGRSLNMTTTVCEIW